MLKNPQSNLQGSNFQPFCCSSCLSSDRCLQPVHNLPDLSNICNGVSFSSEDRICYECKAILMKTLKFKERAVRAMAILCSLQQNNISKSDQQSDINSLSSLTCSNVKNTFDAEYDLSNNNIVPPFKVENIKIESEDKNEDFSEFLELNMDQSAVSVYSEPALWKQETCQTIERSHDDYQIQPTTSKHHQTIDSPPSSVLDSTSAGQLDQPWPSTSTQPSRKAEYYQKTFDEEELLEYREKLRVGKSYKGYNYKCEKCILGWTKRPAWEKHKETHAEKSGVFVCRVCEQRFPLSGACDAHTDTHYRYYECRQCAFRHHTPGVVTIHVQRCHTEHECKICHAVLTNYKELKDHTKSAHEKKLKCNICDISFASTWSLSQHMRRHEGVLPMYECNVCNKKLTSKGSLKSHTALIHAYNAAAVDESAFCVECLIQFKSKQRYKRHLQTSTKHTDARFECGDCGLKCSSKSNVRSHIEIHHLRIPRYECETCNQKFISARLRSRHERSVHRGVREVERRHVCDLCGKKFTVAKTLQEHLNSHYGLRPYKCNICGDTFSYSGALYTHNKLVHLKQKLIK